LVLSKVPIGILKYFALGIWGVTLLVLVADEIVQNAAASLTYDQIQEVPPNRVGLLLGTSKYTTTKYRNRYFTYRIDAAEKLFKAGKIDFILISGDNATMEYNEPKMMEKDLLERGIPKERIFLDYAGFRTLDSVIRAWKVFGQKRFTVISQKFHNERSIYIAKKNGLQAIGFNAQDVTISYGFKTKLRERFARVKVLLDMLFDVEPKFLGEPIEVK
jgi:SanA protein